MVYTFWIPGGILPMAFALAGIVQKVPASQHDDTQEKYDHHR
jgi:hypothetical protein